MGTLRYNTWQNPDGTENYKCRAWVNFAGSGTPTIRGSGNISSITDNGAGDYTLNFATAMPDTNYAVNAAADWQTGDYVIWIRKAPGTITAGSVRLIMTDNAGTSRDSLLSGVIDVTVFR